MVMWLSKCSLFNVGTIFLCLILLLLIVIDPTMQAYDHHTNNKASKFVEHFLGSRKGDNMIGIHHIKQYFAKYGYLSPSHVQTDSNNDGHFNDELEAAVKKYQVFFHLNVSGVLDSKTLSLMGTPRCGNSDHDADRTLQQHNITKSFYVLHPTKWNKRNLSFSIKPGTRPDATDPINSAIAAWDRVSALTFVGDEFSKADLKFSFLKGEHGDNNPFDGPGNELGHSFYPPNGNIHIDADEKWVVGKFTGGVEFDIYTLVLHEIGHAIGLEHSSVESSIMWPVQFPGTIKDLGKDDIDGIKALYP
ncbi:metalloendoproteinase 3-MMP-like [Impatiens glandulifera]|uniref:metalloendoproteinase 3-MMP-like n=1 Tax=Impatiens glandulifera TaxID=253017 RepID=UPI001FB0951C|nr:metalloendoproteinase 3-MMP-like [Impatiens glandulifera]